MRRVSLTRNCKLNSIIKRKKNILRYKMANWRAFAPTFLIASATPSTVVQRESGARHSGGGSASSVFYRNEILCPTDETESQRVNKNVRVKRLQLKI